VTALGYVESKETQMASQADDSVLELLTNMNASSVEAATVLDSQTLMLIRIAALVAVDAPPASYMLNLQAAGEAGVDADQVQDVLAAVAPIVGTPRVVSAAGKLVRAYGLKTGLTDMGFDE
jgi:alkylhydroperoxidase/carboxymuconolactone decarboxylase family protein YurZ